MQVACRVVWAQKACGKNLCLDNERPDAENVTLPALQMNFLNIFFVFAWEFCILKNGGDFG